MYFVLNFNTYINNVICRVHACDEHELRAFPKNNKINISNIESGFNIIQRFGGIAKSLEFFKLFLPDIGYIR